MADKKQQQYFIPENDILIEFENVYNESQDYSKSNTIYKDFSYTMQEAILTNIDAVANTIRYLILFPKGTRKYNRNLGLSLEYAIYDPFDDITKANLEEDIRNIQYLDDRLTITKVEIELDYEIYAYKIYFEFEVVGLGKGSIAETLQTIHS